MSNPTFILGANTFTFSRGRTNPVDDPRKVNVVADYTEGGQLYAYDKGIVEKFFFLTFDGLTIEDYENFDNWLVNIAVGPKNLFIYSDADEINHVVRLLDTQNPLRGTTAGVYSGTITLRQEMP